MMRSKFLLLATLLSLGYSALADSMIRFNYDNADLTSVITDYAKASGQKFIIDPTVRGKITIINPDKVTVTEAFNQLSTALATNGYAISNQEGEMVIKPARQIQRDYIEVSTQLPKLKPERMFSWIVNLKNRTANEVNRELRILTSRDGEVVSYAETNQLIFTDWVSNLYRVQKILEQVDQHLPAHPVVKTKATGSKIHE